MSDPSQECPSGFRMYESKEKGIRACGRQPSSTGSCVAVKFPSKGISYSEVCGRIVGYQHSSTDAVDDIYGIGDGDINSCYVDGVSLTRGNPRKHIWTFMAGIDETNVWQDGDYQCPCAKDSKQTGKVPSFVGSDYFCESGNSGHWGFGVFYTDDPLWDGKLCRSFEKSCCDIPGFPWFHKVLNSNTIDYIELRVCGDQSTWDEDVPVGMYEIYVKN